MRVLVPGVWKARRAAHEERVDGWLAPYLERRRAGAAHPVEDFLFTYYSYRPARLRRWHPGAGVVLAGADPAAFGPDYLSVGEGARLDAARVLARRRDSVAWTRALLARTAARPAHLGCLGLHEWAMVYRQAPDEVRHSAWPLRLGPEHTSAVVAELPVRCSHFDAFRFFTPAARPLNALQPTRHAQPALEQPGCLHANMDLYKWAYKLSPLVPSELVADCFALAREVRELDMRASPYDLAALGYEPVPIETPEGRQRYVAAQRDFAERAAPLRQRLIDACDAALGLGRRNAGYDGGMTDSADNADVADRVDRRAGRLLPEERATGSADPHAQAEVILEESDVREADPDAAPDSFVEHRTSDQAAD